MNRKQFIVLLALVVVIGAAGLIVRQRGRDSWQSSGPSIGQKLLPSLPVNDIAQITIKSGTNELNLAKHDTLWRVRQRGDYPANFAQISELLLKFSDLKIVQTEEIGQSQLGRFDLLPPGAVTNAATLVEFKDAGGKTLSSLLLGKKHLRKAAADASFGGEGWPDGRYVMAGGGGKNVAVISDSLDNVEPKPESWLNKEFLSIEKPSSISVQFSETTNSWKVTRLSETNDWQLADARPGEKLDSSKISSVTSPFSPANFSDVSPAAAGLTSPTLLTAETFDGFAYTAKIGPKAGDDYPVNFSVSASLAASRTPANNETPEEKTKLDAEFKERHKSLADKLAREKQFENWVYSVPADVVDPVIKPRIELLAGANTEVETNAPAAAGN